MTQNYTTTKPRVTAYLGVMIWPKLVYICVHNASGFAGIVVGSGLINLDLMRDLALATRDGSRAGVRVCRGLNGIYLPFRIHTIYAHIQEVVFRRDVY